MALRVTICLAGTRYFLIRGFKKKDKKGVVMLSSQWVCQRCRKEGEFRKLGAGFVVCSGCGTVHVVTGSGQFHSVGGREPQLLTMCRFLREYID